jgi:hypothetical protein
VVDDLPRRPNPPQGWFGQQRLGGTAIQVKYPFANWYQVDDYAPQFTPVWHGDGYLFANVASRLNGGSPAPNGQIGKGEFPRCIGDHRPLIIGRCIILE